MALDSDAPTDASAQGAHERNERTLGQLVAQATDDLRQIVSTEIALAKTEVLGSLDHVKKGAPLLVVAGVLALYALGLLFTAGAYGLVAAGLPTWLGFLLVAVLLLLVASVAALVGARALKKVNPKPTRAIANAEQTIATLKTAQQTGTVHAQAIPASKSEAPLDPR